MSSTSSPLVVVTRALPQADEFASSLKAVGLKVCLMPILSIETLPAGIEHMRALEALDKFAWLLFTSENGIRCFNDILSSLRPDFRLPETILVGVVGGHTAQIFEEVFKREPSLVSKVSDGEGLANELVQRGVRGKRFLIPGPKKHSEMLPEILRGKGARVTFLPVYSTCPVLPDEERLAEIRNALEGEVVFTFFSPSAFEFLSSGLGEECGILERGTIVSVGPTTSRAIRGAGLFVSSEAREQSSKGMVEAVLQALEKTDKSDL